MLSIIIGRAGSGKTDYIYKKIKALMENKKCEYMIIVPELIFYGLFQKNIVEGMTAGAVKG